MMIKRALLAAAAVLALGGAPAAEARALEGDASSARLGAADSAPVTKATGAEAAAASPAAAAMTKQIAKLANDAIRDVANAVGRYHKLNGTMLWEDAPRYCEEQTPNGRLCSLKDYCPDGPGMKPAGGTQVGAAWAPVNDYHNEWVSIGSDAKTLCQTYTQVDGKTPAWGANPGPAYDFKGNVMCCEGAMRVIGGGKLDATWEETNQFCASLGQRLCRRDEYCPQGAGQAPTGGTLYNGVWSAVYDDENEWVATGYTFPKDKLCMTHTEIAKVKPNWGTRANQPESPRRRFVMCCADEFDNIAGRVTYRNAESYCAQKKKRLCNRSEMCPEGPGKSPRGGLRPGEAWAPVGDSDNEWVSVGVTHPERRCKLHTEALEQKPDWGTTTGWRGHIMCCDGGRESSESAGAAPAEESSAAPAAAAAEESSAAPRRSEESTSAAAVDTSAVDIQLAEQTVKARESEATAKKVERERAQAQRASADAAAAADAVSRALAEEQSNKRRVEEAHKRADATREEAKKRAAQILAEATVKAAQHAKAAEEKKDPASVWINLPKQAELMGPGETVNPINRIAE